MPKPFLITGLPRSRTAWWSVVASTPYSECLHEPAKDCASLGALRDVWMSLSGYGGIADSGIAFQIDKILKMMKPQTLIVLRDPKDVLQSFTRFWGREFDRRPVEAMVRRADAVLKAHYGHPLVKAVRFEDLNDYNVAQRCFEWLMPGIPVKMRRDLHSMRVNVTIDAVREAAHRPHTGWHLQ